VFFQKKKNQRYEKEERQEVVGVWFTVLIEARRRRALCSAFNGSY